MIEIFKWADQKKCCAHLEDSQGEMAAMQCAVSFQPPIPLLSSKTAAAATTIVFSSSLPRKQQNSEKQQEHLQQDRPLKFNLQQQITAATAIVDSDHSKAEPSVMRGSDNLLALQKAAAQKKKKNKRKAVRWNERGVTKAELPDSDHSNVRPMNVRAEWMERIN